MSCDVSVGKYRAIYEPNSYTCSSGQYLPANTLGCVSCTTGFTCTGGTFNFNPDYFQGLSFEAKDISTTTMNNICAVNFPNKLQVIYEPNQHTCNSGYYLPANIDECTQCPQNNKCTGGTFTFNETINQGIEQCIDSYAPNGSDVCYPQILHLSNERPNDIIYLKTTPTTTPSFNMTIGDTTYHANMVTTRTRMTNISEHYLKINVDGIDYWVCDDSMCPGK